MADLDVMSAFHSNGRRRRPYLLAAAGALALVGGGFALATASGLAGSVTPVATLTTGWTWAAGSATQMNATIPADTCSAAFTTYGAEGGSGYEGTGSNGGAFSYGGEAGGTTSVTAGEAYQLDIGGPGNGGGGIGTATSGGASDAPGAEGAGGAPGGGEGGDTNPDWAVYGGSGGAATYLFLGTHSPTTSTVPLLVAGGGGGGGSNVEDQGDGLSAVGGNGGDGGGTVNGGNGTPTPNGEGGATATSDVTGGVGGTGDLPGTDGASRATGGAGGAAGFESGSSSDWIGGGGGGGGGWTGGGGGASSYLFNDGSADGGYLDPNTPVPGGWNAVGRCRRRRRRRLELRRLVTDLAGGQHPVDPRGRRPVRLHGLRPGRDGSTLPTPSTSPRRVLTPATTGRRRARCRAA